MTNFLNNITFGLYDKFFGIPTEPLDKAEFYKFTLVVWGFGFWFVVACFFDYYFSLGIINPHFDYMREWLKGNFVAPWRR